MRKNERRLRQEILNEVARESLAYRTYLIRYNPLNGQWWIEKDGCHICHASSVTDAKQKIDLLV